MTITNLTRHRPGNDQPSSQGLPVPEDAAPSGSPRWAPSRAGILNIWRYYDEVFEFRRGRLLLRGQNGTGKSKALEVLLPFLLDASLRPNRLSTFGTSDRTMHWNLMGEGATGVTRVGYVWLEFHRGTGEWLTCGARLQASAHTSGVQSDFFITTQRIGRPGGLSLVNDAGQPLTRAHLGEALGSNGIVHATATDYRADVRRRLFDGMSEQRYDALITALLQLRTPKLSQRLDPALLSTLLSRALPPLDQAEIALLAEGFERLDRQRQEVERLAAVVDAARAVAVQARGYSRRVLRGASATLISATSAMDGLTRAARESEEGFAQLVIECQDADEHAVTLRQEVAQTRARIEGLTASESYQQGQELDRFRQQVTGARTRAERRRHIADGLSGAAARAAASAQAAGEEADRSRQLAEQARDTLRQRADRVSMSAVAPRGGLDADPQEARLLLVAAITERGRQISEVREVLTRFDRAVTTRQQAEDQVTEAADALQQAETGLAVARAAYAVTIEDQGHLLTAWAAGCTELHLDADTLVVAAEQEGRVLDLVTAARSAASDRLGAETVRVQAELGVVRAEHGQVQAELSDRRARVDVPPPAPLTRNADGTRPGAPLWQLATFLDDVPADVQAAVEAALQASGLLDAWISPDGGIQDGVGHDSFALALGPGAAAASTGQDATATATAATDAGGWTLADVLAADGSSVVSDGVVQGVLRQIGLATTVSPVGAAAIGLDGSWRVANLTGTWSKDDAVFIGAAARERARLARIAALEAQAAGLAAEIDALTDDLTRLEERRRLLDAEVAARPDHAPVLAAQRQQVKSESLVETTSDRLTSCRGRLADAERLITGALRRLTEVAAERALPAERDALDRLDQGLADLRESTEAWVHAHGAARGAAQAARVQLDNAAGAREAAESAQEEAESAEQAAAELTIQLAAVEGSIAQPYLEVLAEIGRTRDRLAQLETDELAAQNASRQLLGRRERLDATRTQDAEKRDQAIAVRDTAGRTLRLLAGQLIEDADPPAGLEIREGVKGTLELARALAAAWPTVPHEPRNIQDALARLSQVVHESREILAQRADLELTVENDVQVLSASMGGLRMSIAALVGSLTAERDASSDDISAAEHELFDTTLTGDTRRHLAARIRQANDLVDGMNAHLDRVRTASQVSVRLTWQVDPALPPGTRAARELLLKDPVLLSEPDRQALHAFFRQRIDDARAANTAASWEEQLGEVFDYTAWHQFVVKIDRAKGSGWENLTKKLHGALSGGEKAIALHLPLFAAVAAHYAGVPASPRLILLDEVFVGVDTANRGQVFALLQALDLDLVLTSDHEWCTYRELDGIAVHQLVTGEDGDDAVTSVRFTWDGYLLAPDPETDPETDPELAVATDSSE